MPLDLIDRSRSASLADGRRLIVNPTYQDLLADNGLTSPEEFVSLEGAIVSGHPDRHVMRIEIAGVRCYLKREHQIPIRDRAGSWLAGFGFASVSMREAETLRILRRIGISVPEWIAAGESSDGRAFLLLRDEGSKADLRTVLARYAETDRRALARRIAIQIAEIHDQGVSYPDLYAKHILVDPDGEHLTFLDWQRSRFGRMTWRDRCRDLAGLHASLAEHLADRHVRLEFLLAYWRATSDHSMPFSEVSRRIEARAARLLNRSSIREQRLKKVRESQPLFWLDGEALCVTTLGRQLLQPNEIARAGYPSRPSNQAVVSRQQLTIGDNRSATLTIRRAVRPIAGAWEGLRGRRSSAPECREAARLLRQERLGEPACLLAFGQRRITRGVVDSFLMTLVDHVQEGRSR